MSDVVFLEGKKGRNPQRADLRVSSRWTLLLTVLLMLTGMSVGQAEQNTEQMEFFESKIRPILSNQCYKCHSAEQGAAKGGLTLDTREGVLKGGETGPIIVPGDPEKSLLITAVRYNDSDLKMPKKNKLADEEIEALTEWVRLGAPDPRVQASLKLTGLNDKARAHWAFQPVQSDRIPDPKNIGWCQSPVDRFILKKLEEKGMTPASPANREALIRRAYYDLIGLPPSPKEIEDFKSDQSPNAFSKIVERLLASNHYGERWGRHWLDTARYADTVGSSFNVQLGNEYRYPYAWGYRDYVIASFNQDKPYDQFILEQLAADKLPDVDKNSPTLSALGFLTVGARFNNMNEEINERIDVVSKGFLGVTVSCARCHDHPFDPIPTTDYYSFHGIFASTEEPPEKPIVKTPEIALYQEFLRKYEVIEKANREAYLKVALDLNANFLKQAPLYLKYASIQLRGKLTATEIDERNLFTSKDPLEKDRLESLIGTLNQRDNHDPTFGPFRQLSRLTDEEFPQKAPELVKKILAAKSKSPGLNPLLDAAFQETPLTSRQQLVDLYANFFAQAAPYAEIHLRNIFQPSLETEEHPVPNGSPNPLPTSMNPDLAPFLTIPITVKPESELTTPLLRRFVQTLPNSTRNLIGKFKPTIDLNAINLLELTDPGSPDRAMAVTDVAKPHDSPVFIRGQAQVKGAVVPRRFLSMLSPEGKAKPFKMGSGRLELARAITDPKNPLTPRVLVNRVWMHHFGAGLVPTPDNLGTQSEAPSHPELLDYLASYFLENNMSIKQLHRLIMLSSVYQESSTPNPEYQLIDPDNRLLWRANVRRLDFESLRDSLFVFSGKLDESVGGKPVNLVDEPYSYRRSVYGYIDRGKLPELMTFFDFSNADSPNSRRNSTIVPQQALFLMNSPMIIGVVRDMMARPEFTQATSDEAKVTALYRIILQRTPKPQEIALAQKFIEAEKPNDPPPSSNPKPPPVTPPSPSPTEAPAMMSMMEMDKGKEADKAKDATMMTMMSNIGPKAAIRNQGNAVQRKPLSAWESFAQTLLMVNEMSYVN